jgi:hypothetical protein
MTTETLRIPKSAMICAAAASVDGTRITMKANSGRPFPHPHWGGKLCLDLSGMEVSKEKLPLLLNHDHSKPIGWFNRSDIDTSDGLNIEGTLISSAAGTEFSEMVKQGLPFESSLYAQPSEIERLTSGDQTEVNGHPFEGEGAIFRKWKLRECSACILGADSDTSAGIFSFADAGELVTVDAKLIADDDEKWLQEMLSFAEGSKPDEQPTLGDSEDDEAVREMLKLARDPRADVI